MPIIGDMAKSCRQRNDKAYIGCLNKKDNEFISPSFFPDLMTKMVNARKEVDQKLISKKITRKEFLENAAKLQENLRNDINDRIANDIKTGVYTGKY
jgi:hypothetical protein